MRGNGRSTRRTGPARQLAAALAGVVTAISLAACGSGSDAEANATGADNPDTLKIGLPPGEADPKFQEQFTPVTDLIADSTGKSVDVTTTSDYLAIVEAMRSKLIDVAVFSPFPTPLAEQVADVQPLVVAKGAPYSSVIVCDVDSGVKELADLDGKSIAWVDPGSTSGNYIPKLMLKRAGVDPEKDVEGTYAGGHDVAELAVQQGSTDCAADAKTSYQQMVDQGVIDGDQQKIIAESDPIPISLVIIMRAGLDPKIGEQITDGFTTDPDPKVLEVVGATSFDKAKESDFTIFKDAAKELGVDLSEIK